VNIIKKLVLLICILSVSVIINADSTEADAKLIEKVKEFITKDFKDPDSAKFRDIIVVRKKKKDGTMSENVCGAVNGKNSYGAYVGYKVFYYSDGWGEIKSADNSYIFKDMFDIVCK